MDNIFEQYIENMVKECLSMDKFMYLPEAQRQQLADQLRDLFYNTTINTLIDQLNEEQLTQIQDLNPEDPILDQKLQEFAATTPGFYETLEGVFRAKLNTILQTGQIPTE
jgi:hypothetical protein